MQNKRLLTAGLVVVALATIALLLLVIQLWTASPYADVGRERAQQARERVEAGRRTGPPGNPLPGKPGSR